MSLPAPDEEPEHPAPVAEAPEPPAPQATACMLELELPPGSAAQMLRLPEMAAWRVGRLRSTRHSMVFHDSADDALARQGCALLALRDGWRLELLRPEDAPRHGTAWHPGTTAPILAQAAQPGGLAAAFGADLPAVLPIARFDGRLRQLDLRIADLHGTNLAGLATLAWHEGMLLAFSGECPVLRATLIGPGPVLAPLAALLAGNAGARLPGMGMAEQARRLAQRAVLDASLPPARLHAAHSVSDALAAILGDQLAAFVAAAARMGDQTDPRPVHQMRVALRRMRSALVIFAPALPKGADTPVAQAVQLLRQLARLLGPPRDWDVFLSETGAELRQALVDDARVARLLAAAVRRRDRLYTALKTALAGPDVATALALLAVFIAARRWQEGADAGALAQQAAGLADFAAQALERRCRRVLNGGTDLATLPLAALHRLRKKVKILRYGVEFFGDLYGKPAARYAKKLGVVQEALGHVNDTVTAGDLMEALGSGGAQAYAVGAVTGYVVARSGPARHKALKAWATFRKKRPFWRD